MLRNFSHHIAVSYILCAKVPEQLQNVAEDWSCLWLHWDILLRRLLPNILLSQNKWPPVITLDIKFHNTGLTHINNYICLIRVHFLQKRQHESSNLNLPIKPKTTSSIRQTKNHICFGLLCIARQHKTDSEPIQTSNGPLSNSCAMI